MNAKLMTLLAICTSIAVCDTTAQNRDRQQGRGEGRGFGGPPGGDRGGPPGGERGGPPDRGQGQRPNMMTFLPVLKALDADGNGEISAKEIANAAAALKTLDRNRDGKLTEDEVRPSGPPGGGRPGGDRPEGGNFDRPGGNRENMDRGPGGPPREGASAGGPERPDPNEMVKRLMAFDKNGDGKLGKDELSERMQSLIARADTDKDGFASKEELLKMAAGQGGQGGRGGDRGGRGFGGPQGERSAPPESNRPRRPEFEN